MLNDCIIGWNFKMKIWMTLEKTLSDSENLGLVFEDLSPDFSLKFCKICFYYSKKFFPKIGLIILRA